MIVGISRKLKAKSHIKQEAQKAGFELVQEPFIAIEHSSFELPSAFYDWIFFGSSNAVKSYFSQHPIPNKKIGVYGKATEKALPTTVKANFVGQSNMPSQVAASFANSVGNSAVFFPESNKSRRSISAALKNEQRLFATAYRTSLIAKKLAKNCTVFVFTSPSNVEGFLLENNPANTKAIAIGSSTLQSIENKGFKSISIAPGADEQAIWEAICKEV